MPWGQLCPRRWHNIVCCHWCIGFPWFLPEKVSEECPRGGEFEHVHRTVWGTVSTDSVGVNSACNACISARVSWCLLASKCQGCAQCSTGVVHANVGQNVTPHNPSLGLFLYHFYILWACDITSQSTTTQTTNKHHHHGDGTARPSSGMDLMIPRHPRGGRPCPCLFRGRCWRILFDSLN